MCFLSCLHWKKMATVEVIHITRKKKEELDNYDDESDIENEVAPA